MRRSDNKRKAPVSWRVCMIAGAAALAATSASPAANLFWDANAGTAGTGGTGAWDTASSLWRLDTATGGLQTYDNTAGNMTANLGGTAGTLTIAPGLSVNANLINSTVASNVINGADSTSSLNLDGTTPTIATAGNALTINAKISGSAGLTKTGVGTFVISGVNTFTGGFTWNETNNHILRVGSNTALGSGTITLNGSGNRVEMMTVGNGADRVLTNNITTSKTEFRFGDILGTNNSNLTLGNFAKAGGNLNFNVYNARTTVGDFTSTGGTLVKGAAGAFIVTGNYSQTGGTTLTISAGSIAVGGTVTSPKANLNGGQLGRNGSLTAALNVGNSVAWANNATGGLFAFGNHTTWGNAANNLTVNFGNAGAAVTWNGTGSGFVTTGVALQLGNTISNGTLTFVNGINLNGDVTPVQTINVAKGATNTAGGADARLTGQLTNGGLSITGDGTLELSNGTNSYAGGTTFAAGKLLLTNATGTATGSGPVAINSGTLATGPTGLAAGTVTLGGTSKIIPGDASAGILTVGGLTLTGGTSLVFANVGDLINVANALSYTGSGTIEVTVPSAITSPYTLINFGSTDAFATNFVLAAGTNPQFALELQSNKLVVAVPEPATLALLVAGAGLLTTRRRRIA